MKIGNKFSIQYKSGKPLTKYIFPNIKEAFKQLQEYERVFNYLKGQLRINEREYKK